MRKLSPVGILSAGKRSFSLGQAKAEKWLGMNDEMRGIRTRTLVVYIMIKKKKKGISRQREIPEI